jgi:ABC-type multidrug transport system permease subunit
MIHFHSIKTVNNIIFMSRIFQKLLRQDYVVLSWRSSLRKLYGGYHELDDNYEISISQLTVDFPFTCIFLVSLSLTILYSDLTMSNTMGVL